MDSGRFGTTGAAGAPDAGGSSVFHLGHRHHVRPGLMEQGQHELASPGVGDGVEPRLVTGGQRQHKMDTDTGQRRHRT